MQKQPRRPSIELPEQSNSNVAVQTGKHGITGLAIHLAGFMLGSLRKVWPWKEPNVDIELGNPANILPAQFTPEVVGAIFLMLTAFVLVMLLEYLSTRRFSGSQVAVSEK